MKTLRILCGILLATAAVRAADPVESDYYKITTFETPKETAMEVSSIEVLPDGKLSLGTRRGEIWTVSNADSDPANVKYQLFASGQHEVMGLAYKDGALFMTNRYEVARLKDSDGDGRADKFDTVCDKWGVSGDYHEYSFGSRFDKDGDIWVVLCLTGSFSSQVPFRGWCVRVKPDGTMVPTTSGVRSPGGIVVNYDNEVYYTDNQGPWHGACTLQHLVPGSFQGHPGGNKWYDLAPNMGPRPVEPIPEAFQGSKKRGEKSDRPDPGRMDAERKRIKELVPPVVYMVHGKIGNSSSFIVPDLSGGKFGPFSKAALHRRPEPQQPLARLHRGGERHQAGCRVSVPQGLQVRPHRRTHERARATLRRRQRPRLGREGRQAVFIRARGLDRQGAL